MIWATSASIVAASLAPKNRSVVLLRASAAVARRRQIVQGGDADESQHGFDHGSTGVGGV
jgi:hypothetical protein